MCEVSDGWRLRMNGAGFVMLHYVLEGSGQLATPHGSLPLAAYSRSPVEHPPGAAALIDSGETIQAETTTDDVAKRVGALVQFLAGPRGRDDLVVVCGRLTVRYGDGPGLFDLLEEPLVLDFSDSTQMRDVFTHLLEEEGNLSPGAEVMMTTLLRQCLVLVLRRLCEDSHCTLPWLAALDDPRLARVLDQILDDPGRPYTVESLAADAFRRSAFVAQFAAALGPCRWPSSAMCGCAAAQSSCERRSCRSTPWRVRWDTRAGATSPTRFVSTSGTRPPPPA